MDALKQTINELHQSNHGWWIESERLREELQAVYCSKSWRITWPLRKLMQFITWLVHIPFCAVIWLIRLPKRTVRYVLVRLMAYALKNPSLKLRARRFLHKYTWAEDKLRALALARGLLSQSHKEEVAIVEEDECLLPGDDIEAELSLLTPQARRIYADLKGAIEK